MSKKFRSLPVFFVLALFAALPASAVIIGVVDSGTDDRHPELSSKMWTNTGEVAGDNQDNDSNTYVDDIHGWNFAIFDF
jgi:hypothetical protein